MISTSRGHIAVISPNGFERALNPSLAAGAGPGGAARGGGLRQTLWSPPAMAGPPQPQDLVVGTGGVGSPELRDAVELQRGGEGPATPSLRRPRVSAAISGAGGDIPCARGSCSAGEIQKQRGSLLLPKNFRDL